MAKHYKNEQAIEVLAKNVRKYRQAKGISMEILADIVGLEYSVIARLELQKSNPSVSLIYLIAQALDIEPNLLLVP